MDAMKMRIGTSLLCNKGELEALKWALHEAIEANGGETSDPEIPMTSETRRFKKQAIVFLAELENESWFERCKACDHRASKGLEGQCPSCASEREKPASFTTEPSALIKGASYAAVPKPLKGSPGDVPLSSKVKVTERSFTREDRVAANCSPDMPGVYGYVFTGPMHTVYLTHNDSNRNYTAGWSLQCGKVQALIRTEKQGRKVAIQWAAEGFPSEQS